MIEPWLVIEAQWVFHSDEWLLGRKTHYSSLLPYPENARKIDRESVYQFDNRLMDELAQIVGGRHQAFFVLHELIDYSESKFHSTMQFGGFHYRRLSETRTLVFTFEHMLYLFDDSVFNPDDDDQYIKGHALPYWPPAPENKPWSKACRLKTKLDHLRYKMELRLKRVQQRRKANQHGKQKPVRNYRCYRSGIVHTADSADCISLSWISGSKQKYGVVIPESFFGPDGKYRPEWLQDELERGDFFDRVMAGQRWGYRKSLNLREQKVWRNRQRRLSRSRDRLRRKGDSGREGDQGVCEGMDGSPGDPSGNQPPG